MMILPFASYLGIASLVVSAVIGFALRFTRVNTDHPESKPRPSGGRIAARICFIVSLLLFACCFGVVFSILESPIHAWRNRTHTTTLSGVDAVTGRPVPIDYDSVTDPPWDDDPFVVDSGTWNRPDAIEIEWNVPLLLTVTSPGYKAQSLKLNAASPNPILIRMSPIAVK